jgi:hypothetical protein
VLTGPPPPRRRSSLRAPSLSPPAPARGVSPWRSPKSPPSKLPARAHLPPSARLPAARRRAPFPLLGPRHGASTSARPSLSLVVPWCLPLHGAGSPASCRAVALLLAPGPSTRISFSGCARAAWPPWYSLSLSALPLVRRAFHPLPSQGHGEA